MQQQNNSKQLKLSHAICWIFFSVFVTCGPVVAWIYQNNFKPNKTYDPAYNITTLVQKPLSNEHLPTLWFAEQLNLSFDQPVNIFNFDETVATKSLQRLPLIKHVIIEKILPNALLIEYEPRIPLFFLANLSNTAISSDGYLIPLKPFFTPKTLPSIIIADEFLPPIDAPWGHTVDESVFMISNEFLKTFSKTPSLAKYRIHTIDFSNVFSSSLGKKQIVVSLLSKAFVNKPTKIYLRICTENYSSCLFKLAKLIDRLPAASLEDKTLIIDLRLPKLAYYSFKTDFHLNKNALAP